MTALVILAALFAFSACVNVWLSLWLAMVMDERDQANDLLDLEVQHRVSMEAL